jgi:hypothetical protein
MVGVVCNSHVEEMKKRLLAMQSVGALSEGKIKLQPVKMVMTDCVRVDNEYNIELDYKINSKNVRNPNLSL